MSLKISAVIKRCATSFAERQPCQPSWPALVKDFCGLVFFVLLLSAAERPTLLAAGDEPKSAAKNDSEHNAKDAPKTASLSGRLVDENGKPVTDAKLKLWSNKQGQPKVEQTTEVDDEGHYQFDEVPEKEEYLLEIESTRWLGLTNWSERPRLLLSPKTTLPRDFTLPRACRLMVRVLDDETGLPVKGVSLYVAQMMQDRYGNSQTIKTDDDGWATISRPKSTEGNYIVGAVHKDYGLEHLIQTLDNPERVPRRTIHLRKGKSIIGHAVCSDGKPPVGWQITAIPAWWHFNVYPLSSIIDDEGLYELKHIVPGKYNVAIFIPSSIKTVLANSELAEVEEPLEVTLDYPSPGALDYINGTLEIEGELPRGEYLRIQANSNVGNHFSHQSLVNGAIQFRLGPIPKGPYRIEVTSASIESINLNNIEAPKDELVIKVRVRGKPRLHGVVLNDETGQPVEAFSLRVTKIRTLSGPNYAEDSTWKGVSDQKGEFVVDVLSPGEYQVTAIGDGFGPVTSETLNTVERPDQIVSLKLKPGITLQGLVVDEKGKPVSGATVTSLTLAGRDQNGSIAETNQSFGVAKTVDGHFSLLNLAEGPESLRVVHPDFCPNFTLGIQVQANSTEPIKVTLLEGGTVSGYVYNEQGEPEPNIPLHFHVGGGYNFMHSRDFQLAHVVTDRTGFYKVQHLPLQLIHATREASNESRGVVRRAIMTENGKTRTLNFGGTSRVTGRIQVNGQPLSERRIQLGSGNQSIGVMHQFAITTKNGEFVFRGAAPGRWLFSYQIPGSTHEWARVLEVEIPANGMVDLGLIEQQTTTVTINLATGTPEQLAEIQLQFTEFDPTRMGYRNAGRQMPRQAITEPFVIEQVPPGDYEISAYLKNNTQVVQRLTITAENPNPTIELTLPKGTSAVSGIVDKDVYSREKNEYLALWNANGRWSTRVIPKDDGTFQLDQLAAGTYEIRQSAIRNWPAIFSFTLADAENKSIHLSQDNVKKTQSTDRTLFVKSYSSDGIPTPCEIKLEGSQGRVMPNSPYDESTRFTAPVGTYQLRAALPGFKPFMQNVELLAEKQGAVNVTIQFEPIAE